LASDGRVIRHPDNNGCQRHKNDQQDDDVHASPPVR
jgi:hypothetical protein